MSFALRRVRLASFLEVFGAGHGLRTEPAPKPPEPEVGPPITPVEAPAVDAPLTTFEPPAIDQPTRSAPEALLGTSEGEVLTAKKTRSAPSATKALLGLAGFVIGAVLLAAFFHFAHGDKSVPLQDPQKQASLAVTQEGAPDNRATPSPAEKAPSPAVNTPAPENVTLKPGISSVPSKSSAKSVSLESGNKSVSLEPGAAWERYIRGDVEVLGMMLSNLSDETRKEFSIDNAVTSGVVVTNVDPGSSAANQGIHTGDVVMQIDFTQVKDLADFERAIQVTKRAGNSAAFQLGVNPRSGRSFDVYLALPPEGNENSRAAIRRDTQKKIEEIQRDVGKNVKGHKKVIGQ